MLKSLSIKNFAVIQNLEIVFQAGLNLLTGETGSGKSIIVDALGLLLGGRSVATQIRTGEKTAIIEGRFELKPQTLTRIRQLLREFGDHLSHELLIRRELSVDSKNRIYINQRATTLSVLRSLQPLLVETYGQGEQRALLSTQSHLGLLDQFADCIELKRQVAESYSQWHAAERELGQTERENTELKKAAVLLQYQLAEIQALAPQPYEDEQLQAERKLLTHAETALKLASEAYWELYESDESILARLSLVRKSLQELSALDGRLTPTVEMMEGLVSPLSDVADTLRHYGETLEFSPTRLAEIEERLAALEKLKRRYNTDLQGVFKVLDEQSERLANVNEMAEREVMLRATLRSAELSYKSLAKRLSKVRHAAKSKLEQRVMRDLKHLALENAQFIVNITSPETDASDNALGGSSPPDFLSEPEMKFSPDGMDRVEFLLSANPGESPRPLAHVASGGELSRLMLTLRTIGNTERQVQEGAETLIFDEVDVGIGGRVAETVGRRLKSLATAQQVLCVTHQPQIARFANQHYLIEKRIEKGRTLTVVKQLSQDERVGELARMIGGDEEASAARETARWLLESRENEQPSARRSKKRSSH